MGNHRALPYAGTHFSKKDISPGILTVVLTVLGSLIVSVAVLFAGSIALMHLGIPIKVTVDGAPLAALFSMVSSQ